MHATALSECSARAAAGVGAAAAAAAAAVQEQGQPTAASKTEQQQQLQQRFKCRGKHQQHQKERLHCRHAGRLLGDSLTLLKPRWKASNCGCIELSRRCCMYRSTYSCLLSSVTGWLPPSGSRSTVWVSSPKSPSCSACRAQHSTMVRRHHPVVVLRRQQVYYLGPLVKVTSRSA